MPKSPSCFIAFVFFVVVGASGFVFALEYELSPNPNPGANTIDILSGDIGNNTAEPFENYGAITVRNGGTLRNLAEMDILFDEDGGGGLSTITIEAGGLFETFSGTKTNFDSISHFNVSGTVNNAGDISSDWSMQLAVGSQFNNSGILTNKQAGTFRGTFVNTGAFINFTPYYDTGGFFQQIGDYTNEVGSSMTNYGELLNFTTITNRGTILNTINGSSGVGRGIFRNMSLLNNDATGVITNRHRWFNTGALNNAGTFTNHAIGLGMANQLAGSIHNLPSGIFNNNQSLISTTEILNEGNFFINSPLSGSGTYTQTAGATVVSDRLAASAIDIQGGLLTGIGTVEGPVIIGSTAIVSPGNSPGTLTVDGSYVQQAGSLLSIEIGGIIAGSEFDSLSIIGSAGLDGTLDVSLVDTGSGLFSPSTGNSFEILTATGGITGQYALHNLPVLSSGLAWDVIYGANTVTLSVKTTLLTADFNVDGFVDELDLAQWDSSFGIDT